MQKAMKWLDAKGIAYTFHDYKVLGIDKATLGNWLKHLPLNKVVNAQSTTYRALSDAEKESVTNKSKAITLMIKNPSLIKRPVWDFGNGILFLGWDEQELNKLV